MWQVCVRCKMRSWNILAFSRQDPFAARHCLIPTLVDIFPGLGRYNSINSSLFYETYLCGEVSGYLTDVN